MMRRIPRMTTMTMSSTMKKRIQTIKTKRSSTMMKSMLKKLKRTSWKLRKKV
jgi:hypothetical protein